MNKLIHKMFLDETKRLIQGEILLTRIEMLQQLKLQDSKLDNAELWEQVCIKQAQQIYKQLR
jgi:hypothetical protein